MTVNYFRIEERERGEEKSVFEVLLVFLLHSSNNRLKIPFVIKRDLIFLVLYVFKYAKKKGFISLIGCENQFTLFLLCMYSSTELITVSMSTNDRQFLM